jgi:hypothetical protein
MYLHGTLDNADFSGKYVPGTATICQSTPQVSQQAFVYYAGSEYGWEIVEGTHRKYGLAINHRKIFTL